MEPAIIGKVAGAVYGTRPTLKTTWDLCLACVKRSVPGDFVECGVAAGAHPAIMAVASGVESVRRRTTHLFDSFCGIPEAGPKDDETITDLIGKPKGQGRRLRSTGKTAHSIESVQANMKKWGVPEGRLAYHQGWFQQTVPKAVQNGDFPRGIAVLRLDGDLYESTMVCLEHLHPLVPSGGFVIIDDYALTGCRLAVTEYLASHVITPEINLIPGGNPGADVGPMWYQKP